MRYRVHLQVFGSISVEVEAASEDEAREKAQDEACVPALCWHCADVLDLGDEVGDITWVEAMPE